MDTLCRIYSPIDNLMYHSSILCYTKLPIGTVNSAECLPSDGLLQLDFTSKMYDNLYYKTPCTTKNSLRTTKLCTIIYKYTQKIPPLFWIIIISVKLHPLIIPSHKKKMKILKGGDFKHNNPPLGGHTMQNLQSD